MRNRQWLATALLLQFSIPGIAAEESSSALQTCRAEKSDSKRLACYDRLMDSRIPAPQAKAETAPADSGSTPQTPEEKFGYSDVRAQEERGAALNDANRLKELVAKVTAVSTRPNGTHVVTLENGQVWVQKTPEPFFRVSVGDEITIRPAALGTYLMSTPDSRSTRVMRTQ